MHIPGVTWAWKLVRSGQTGFLIAEAWMRLYKGVWEWLFALKHHSGRKIPLRRDFKLSVQTKFPIAYESPDHLAPFGTTRDNSTNKKFVDYMASRLTAEIPRTQLGVLDLGCSGGQLVKDFLDLGWMAVGLEGSDFSLKHRRANWPALAGKNLFTCDITKPFVVQHDRMPAQFHLITMWEVLEHIHTRDLPQLFNNIMAHLDRGGYFVASTTSTPDIHDGVDLHQTKWPNAQWHQWLAENYPELQRVDLDLKFYQFVRHNAERSFLSYRRT
jgi:2-polyprenyl-3-methyl-5-hydroxy-6-metoxy-1,4-benzoquinol methylase